MSAADKKTCLEAFTLYDVGGGKIEVKNLGAVSDCWH